VERPPIIEIAEYRAKFKSWQYMGNRYWLLRNYVVYYYVGAIYV
jgi:hypothetical protein